MWVSEKKLNAKKHKINLKTVEVNQEFAESDIVASFAHNRPIELKKVSFLSKILQKPLEFEFPVKIRTPWNCRSPKGSNHVCEGTSKR